MIAFVGSCWLVIAWMPDAPLASAGFGVMAAGLGAILLRLRQNPWKQQCIETQKALKKLYRNVERYQSYPHLSTRMDLSDAMDEAGKWF